jgi:antitoxin (DNA-binding transcriptional repressor) of toxin-antitoxin stability system
MRYVSVAELKAKLSYYLGEVREGASLYVTHHQQPVAEISPYHADEALTIQAPDQPVEMLSNIKGISLKGNPGQTILMKDRGRR